MEHELFGLIKEYLESLEFTVKAEVNDVDIVGVKDDLLVLVEMKTSLNIPLIAQGIKRNKLSEVVYLAIPKPSLKVLRSKLFKDKCLVVKHLGLGLMFVDVKNDTCEVLFDPSTRAIRKTKKKRAKLLREFSLRKTAHNTGGVSRRKIITAYRELALLALDFLKDGEKTTKEMREYTKGKKVTDILQKNYYGWFERVSRGRYQMTDKGEAALKEYDHVIAEIKENERLNSD